MARTGHSLHRQHRRQPNTCGADLIDLGQRDLRLRPCRPPVLGQCLRHPVTGAVQFSVRNRLRPIITGTSSRASIREHLRLAIGGLVEHRGILRRAPDPMRPLLRQRGVVDDKDGIGSADQLVRLNRELLFQRRFVPEGSSQRVAGDDGDRIWFEDEARIGQKNGLVRQWARRERDPGSQPTSAMTTPICSVRSVRLAASRQRGVAVDTAYATPPRRDRTRRRRGLTRRAAARSRPMAQDRQTERARNITPIFLPSRTPELNPDEKSVSTALDVALEHRLRNYDAIVDAACDAWRKFIAWPKRITSIGMRKCAHIGQLS